MEDYLIILGRRIKEIRKKNSLTISVVATNAGVSNGLISRIENGRTIPSLPVLLNIIKALGMEVSDFFHGLPKSDKNNFLVVRKEDNTIIEKEDDAKGFVYQLLFTQQLTSVAFEAVLLELHPGSEREKVETDAFEFKYILSGECWYVIGEDEVLLKEGDSLFFDGRIPHVPVNRSNAPSRMLVLYFFLKND